MTTPHEDPVATEALDDGNLPDDSLPGLVDDLEKKVLEEQDNPLLDIDEDADAREARNGDGDPPDEPSPV